ncbi:insulin-induced protein-domain-containing protein [Ilyonectria destructans]|nr:insulin-induced protein-domain-containing protein [Ilyonectria destructans]
MDDDGPTILRPIPRRPFGLNLTTPTPPDEDSSPATPAPSDLANLRFLQPTPEPLSLTRPQSFLNLTSSTLFGIYSPATPSARDRVFDDRDELDTPWGTGAQTPIKRPSVDEATYELMRDRSHPVRRRSSFRPTEPPVQFAPPPSLMSLALRGLLLFLLGVGYGVLVTTTRFHSGAGNLASFKDGMIRPAYNWAHLAFWGVAGVALGALLPWFDRVWEESFGEGEDDVVVVEKDGDIKDLGSSTDWALVIRAVGAFVGIVFAIRKVAWASTLQVSLSLALVNPLLWWLIDRSKPGFVLAAAVGLTGSAFLLGVNPDMMPTPSAISFGNASVTRATSHDDLLTLGGLARQETVETGVWMLSVLFCSCVCFGNIGRRLAMGRSAAVRGRWAGVR